MLGECSTRMTCVCGHNKIDHHSWEGNTFDSGRNTGECKICRLSCREYRMKKYYEVKN